MDLSKEQIKELAKERRMMMLHNGHIAYQMFTRTQLTKNITITGISSPMEYVPIFVGFINKDLMAIESVNDSTNPDSTVLKTIPVMAVKKTKLKVVK